MKEKSNQKTKTNEPIEIPAFFSLDFSETKFFKEKSESLILSLKGQISRFIMIDTKP